MLCNSRANASGNCAPARRIVWAFGGGKVELPFAAAAEPAAGQFARPVDLDVRAWRARFGAMLEIRRRRDGQPAPHPSGDALGQPANAANFRKF